jgi:tripartite-type tricarboxylate transporter receptor subunit TctC
MKSIVAALALCLAAASAAAQTGYPEQTIRILVGFTPGVAPDITGRILAEKFTEGWGKSVVVDNVSGPAASSRPSVPPRPRPMATRC